MREVKCVTTKKSYLFSSEAVTQGHPDRLCDTISDALVDEFLKQDPYSRIVAESAISKGVIFVAARYASLGNVDIPEVARSVIAGAGYTQEEYDVADSTVVTSLITMSPDQRCQVDEAELKDGELDKLTARNQITLFGYACNHTPELMPLPISLANHLAAELALARQDGRMPYLSPDCTVQAGVIFEKGQPVGISNITLIAGLQRPKGTDEHTLIHDFKNRVVQSVFASAAVVPDAKTEYFVNPAGVFPKSGPSSHSGMTGRKTDSNTYGCFARHSGSALSGKDPSRIDRVGAYAARYAAKNVVAAGLADACEIQLSYSLGHAAPVSIQVQTFGSSKVAEAVIQKKVETLFDFRLGAIVRDFGLRHLPLRYKQGFYRKLAAHGHFGESFLALPWEKTDRTDELKK
jgi:S-adenosylmethionine synthetase